MRDRRQPTAPERRTRRRASQTESPARALERRLEVARFGSTAELRVTPGGAGPLAAQLMLERAAEELAHVDRVLSRFDPASELCQLNAEQHTEVPASPLMLRFAEAVRRAGSRSGGLVDATLLPAVERAGYTGHLEVPAGGGAAVAAPLAAVAGQTDAVRPAGEGDATTAGSWRDVRVADGRVVRPAGVRLDSGGIGKGLAADLAAEQLSSAAAWVVDCGGDLRIGGTDRRPRPVDVRDPVDPSVILHRLRVTSGGVATSGITRRSWDAGGERRHHLIDPRTGEPAATGLLQVTALAPTAFEAEVLAKTALLSGPDGAPGILEHGGVVVAEDGIVTVVAPPAAARRPHPRPRRAPVITLGRRPVPISIPGGAR